MVVESFLSKSFSRLGKQVFKSFSNIITAMLYCGSSNTAEIAKAMSKLNGKAFNSNDKKLAYFLQNEKFQIDDHFWRCHLNMIFSLLQEQGEIKKDEKVYVQVDFTSDTTDFLILSASVLCSNKAIPIYFTMRSYPTRKNTYDHKKMELAFLKGLKHCLSKKYEYVIVADRGFGNERFMTYCEQNGFEHLIRLEPNMMIKYQNKEGILKNIIKEDGIYDITIKNYNRKTKIIRNTKDDKTWYLSSDIEGITHKKGVEHYENRFKIEKAFQDLKSSGFDIESSKIRKYDRFKRLLTLSIVSYGIMIVIGKFIDKNLPKLKKKFPTSTSLISAYLNLPKGVLQCIGKGQL